GEEATTVGAVGDAARYRTRVGADQRGDRAGLGHRRTAAPAGAAAPRPALVAFAGQGAGQRAGQPVRAGAGAEETRRLRPALSAGSARVVPARWAGHGRDQPARDLPRTQPGDARTR